MVYLYRRMSFRSLEFIGSASLNPPFRPGELGGKDLGFTNGVGGV